MADAQDLKSCFPLGKCGFESRLGYFVFFHPTTDWGGLQPQLDSP